MAEDKKPLKDVVHLANDDLFDVVSLLTTVLSDKEFTEQQPCVSRVIRMARERIDEVQTAFNPYI